MDKIKTPAMECTLKEAEGVLHGRPKYIEKKGLRSDPFFGDLEEKYNKAFQIFYADNRVKKKKGTSNLEAADSRLDEAQKDLADALRAFKENLDKKIQLVMETMSAIILEEAINVMNMNMNKANDYLALELPETFTDRDEFVAKLKEIVKQSTEDIQNANTCLISTDLNAAEKWKAFKIVDTQNKDIIKKLEQAERRIIRSKLRDLNPIWKEVKDYWRGHKDKIKDKISIANIKVIFDSVFYKIVKGEQLLKEYIEPIELFKAIDKDQSEIYRTYLDMKTQVEFPGLSSLVNKISTKPSLEDFLLPQNGEMNEKESEKNLKQRKDAYNILEGNANSNKKKQRSMLTTSKKKREHRNAGQWG